jgi:hypothetical protein
MHAVLREPPQLALDPAPDGAALGAFTTAA